MCLGDSTRNNIIIRILCQHCDSTLLLMSPTAAKPVGSLLTHPQKLKGERVLTHRANLKELVPTKGKLAKHHVFC